MAILVFMAGFNSYSQGLSVELGVEWQRQDIRFDVPPLLPNKSATTPFLKVTYRNLTEDKLYFRRIVALKTGYPSIGHGSFIKTEMDLPDQVKRHLDFSGSSYNVDLSSLNDYWDVYNELADRSQSYTKDAINGGLSKIYEVLRAQKLLDSLAPDLQLSCFSDPNKKTIQYMEAWNSYLYEISGAQMDFAFLEKDLTETDIKNAFQSKFVFLKPGEEHTDEIDLIAFYILGGDFTFRVIDDQLRGYFVGVDAELLEFPSLVDGYKLYKGTFLTSSAGIKIKHE